MVLYRHPCFADGLVHLRCADHFHQRHGGSATDATATIGFNNGIIFIVIGMLIGVMVFYMVRSLSAREFSKGAKAALTVLNVVVSALLLWYILWQPTYFKLERWTVAFLCIALITALPAQP